MRRTAAQRAGTFLAGSTGSLPTPEQIVSFLRQTYPEYQRTKNEPLLQAALAALQEHRSSMNSSMRSLYSSDKEQPVQKKRRVQESRYLVSEEELQALKSLEEIGGMDATVSEIRRMLEPVLRFPEIYERLGVSPPQGILLHGPPGCGKTLVACAVAKSLECPFLRVAAPELVSGMSGESEAKVRALFQEAIAQAPCVVFIDEIDSITPKRENAGKDMERRIVAQLLSSLDMLAMQPPGQSVVVIGATNRPDAIDSALRRAGRFDREIAIGIPDEGARESILRVLAQKLRLDGDFEFVRIAKKTSGYVGADLNALTQEAASIAVSRILDSVMDTERLSQEQLDRLSITMNDFEAALKVVQPSAKREGFAMVPDVSWDDIGALEELRKELTMAIALPIACPTLFKSVGLSAPMGVLLFGPPGCGKTLVAKAVANQSGASFISIKGPELLNKYVGESERGIRLLFQRARSSTPCVIFFDELDALCPKRGNGGPSSDSVSERVVNQLLTEMDGLDGRKQVFVIAATNRPDIIDPAMLRPGRLDKLIYVPLPSAEGRLAILSKATRKMPLAQDVNLEEIAASPRCNGFSGADVVSLAREAAQIAIREKTSLLEESFEDVDQDVVISRDHFHQALTRVFPSVSDKQRQRYDSMFSVLCSSRATIQANAE